MFKEELEDLKNRYMTRLVLHHVFSDEPAQTDDPQGAARQPPEGLSGPGAARRPDAPLNMGVVDRAKMAAFLGSVLPAAGIDEAYVCGPFQMNDEVEAALLAGGVTESRIHIERFGLAPQAGGAVVHQALPGDAEAAKVVIIRDGFRREIDFRRDQPSILDAASAAGLEVPFSCTSGVCGTCRAKLVEGRVRMERNFALEKAEVDNGFVLTCQAHPLTERVVLSFDER
jgi:ring-1,2-phenylacetyl-CoA epoxidase subunit PaaE